MSKITNPCKITFADKPYMKNPCICEVCNCGRHRCPHEMKQHLPWDPCVMSEYKANYNPYCLDPSRPLIPDAGIQPSCDPLSDQTTHRVDYQPKPLCPPQQRDRSIYKLPTTPMDSATNYRNEYTPKLCPVVERILPPQRNSCPAKFEGNPTYKSDYRSWSLPPLERHRVKPYQPPCAPFDGLPTYQSDYVAKCDARRSILKPETHLNGVKEPLDGVTSYRVDYIPHPLENRPCEKKPPIPKCQVPFAGLTTVQSDYTPKEFCNPASFKPHDNLGSSDAPLSQCTTNRVDYRQHPLLPPHKHLPDQYKKPDGPMETGTTYRCDYPLLPICKQEPVIIPQAATCPAPFDDRTNYKTDYVPWNVQKNIVKAANGYNLPVVPMETLTTVQAEYVPKAGCKTGPIRPSTGPLNCGAFDGQTNYMIDYTPKSVDCHCPAAYLSHNKVSPDGYSFEAVDPCGHEHYKQGEIKVNA